MITNLRTLTVIWNTVFQWKLSFSHIYYKNGLSFNVKSILQLKLLSDIKTLGEHKRDGYFFFENFRNEEYNSSTIPIYGHGYSTNGKLEKKRTPLSPPLTVCSVRVKWTIKITKISRYKNKIHSIYTHKSKTVALQVQISYKGRAKEFQTI